MIGRGWLLSGRRLVGVVALVLAAGLAYGDDIPVRGAQYDYKTWECTVSGNTYRLKVAHRLTIFNRLGEAYNEIRVSESQYRRVKNFAARVFDANGRELSRRGLNDLTRVCGYEGVSLHSDVCSYLGVMEAPAFPYSIEYEYEEEGKSLFFWRGARLQHDIPVARMTYTLHLDRPDTFRYRIYGVDVTEETLVAPRGFGYRWSAESIPASEDDDHLGPSVLNQGYLDIVPTAFDLGGFPFAGSSWADIGRWYGMLAADRYDDTNRVAGDSDRPLRERVRQAYERVRDDTRYVALSIGLSGWQPHHASRTASLAYGDCKDMSTLLVSRLRTLGVVAFPVLLLTRSEGVIDIGFPSFGFDHVIGMAVVEQDTVWMDPTCKHCAFGDLPSGDEDRDVLVIDESGGMIVRTPASSAEDNPVVRATTLRVDADGWLTVSSRQAVSGNHAQYLRAWLPSQSPERTARYVLERFPGGEKEYRLLTHQVLGLDDPNAPLIIELTAERVKRLDRIGSTVYVTPFVFNEPNSLERLSVKDRRVPLNTYYPDAELDTVVVTWDPALSVDSVVLPTPASFASEIGSIDLSAAAGDTSATIVLVKSSATYEIAVEHFGDFATYCQELRGVLKRHLKLVVRGE